MWTCHWGTFAYKEGKFGFTRKITLILAFNWQPLEQPWDQYQPCLPMMFYPYTEQKELLKAAAVGCSFTKCTGKFALPSLSVSVKEFPTLCTLRRTHWVSHQWAGKYLLGKQCPLFPFPCNWSLFTHLFRHGCKEHSPGAAPCPAQISSSILWMIF